ncbi:MAG: DUF4910 domain-containing protein [Chloroflexi bacterium]|nr:DUF4910 domain-containing protein [Chloroflexota bacterium]
MTDISTLQLAGDLLQRLFPICRSITGDGVRETLEVLRRQAVFEVYEVPSGTACFDWTVPDEWNIREAFIADANGNRLVDFRASNIHVMNYSIPVDAELSFEELAPHLHTLPDLPDAIPYRTTYYNRNWGFCLTQNQFDALDRCGRYHVRIDSDLKPGSLTFGEAFLEGTSGQEFLFSTYCCHPSLANDNLSGVVLWTLLLKQLSQRKTRHSYRFIIIPETIGALAYLSRNQELARKLAGGLVITTVAGPGRFGYKTTFQGNHLLDRLVRLTFKELGLEYIEYPFDVNGSDERQFSSPGFRIPVGTICKDKYYEYLYYHTSLDNLDFVRPENLVQTLQLYLLTIDKLEQNRTYRSLNPHGEPMLGKRGLYPKTGGSIKQRAADPTGQHDARSYQVSADHIIYGNELDAIRWLLFLSDGNTSLLEVAEKTSFPMQQLHDVACKLVEGGLLDVVF